MSIMLSVDDLTKLENLLMTNRVLDVNKAKTLGFDTSRVDVAVWSGE